MPKSAGPRDRITTEVEYGQAASYQLIVTHITNHIIPYSVFPKTLDVTRVSMDTMSIDTENDMILSEEQLKIGVGDAWTDRRGIVRTVTDILTTFNSSGELVHTEYVCRAIVGGVPSIGRHTSTEINRARYGI